MYRERSEDAVSVLELLVGLIVLIPVVLLLIDGALIVLGVQINDNAAREADRMAASGPPSVAESRAQLVVNRLNKSSKGFVSNIRLKSVMFTPNDLVAKEKSLLNYGGIVKGSVNVQTEVSIKSLVVQYVYSGPLNFVASQSCPLSYVVPNTAGGQPIAP